MWETVAMRADLQQLGQRQGIGGPGASVGGPPRCTPPPVLHHSTPTYHMVGMHISALLSICPTYRYESV